MDEESEKEGNEESQDVSVSVEAKKVEMKFHSTEAVTTVIGKAEADKLMDKNEYAAALLVTSVDLEDRLGQNLRNYWDDNKRQIKKAKDEKEVDRWRSWITESDSGSIGKYIGIIKEIYDEDSEYPPIDTIKETLWKESEARLESLATTRNDIVHDVGTYQEINKNLYNLFDSKEDIKELIVDIYAFCDKVGSS